LGIKVPSQVAVAGFNDLPGSEQMLPRLTSVRTPRVEIGKQAAQMLLRLMRGERVETPCLDLGYELMLRDST
jgi:LacI family gluconate utilization system Gnt-I transcriptional repressor